MEGTPSDVSWSPGAGRVLSMGAGSERSWLGSPAALPTCHGSGGSPSPKPLKLLGLGIKQTLLAGPQGEELAWAGNIIADI